MSVALIPVIIIESGIFPWWVSRGEEGSCMFLKKEEDIKKGVWKKNERDSYTFPHYTLEKSGIWKKSTFWTSPNLYFCGLHHYKWALDVIPWQIISVYFLKLIWERQVNNWVYQFKNFITTTTAAIVLQQFLSFFVTMSLFQESTRFHYSWISTCIR